MRVVHLGLVQAGHRPRPGRGSGFFFFFTGCAVLGLADGAGVADGDGGSGARSLARLAGCRSTTSARSATPARTDGAGSPADRVSTTATTPRPVATAVARAIRKGVDDSTARRVVRRARLDRSFDGVSTERSAPEVGVRSCSILLLPCTRRG
ncbi:hypothetical protein GCM10027605_40950 [Micromonospora zhanjiangensis]